MFRVEVVAFGLLCLVFFPVASQTVEAQSYATLAPINKTAVTEFATTFLSSYNALIISQYTRSVDPNTLRYFTLYEATGYSFNVTVMWPGNDSTRFLTFIFVPIMSPSPTPRVMVASNTTLGCLYFFCSNMVGHIIPDNDYGVTLDNSVGVSHSGIITLPFFIMFYSAPLFADPKGFAVGAANWFFATNRKNIPTPPSATSQQTSNQNPSAVSPLLTEIIVSMVVAVFGGAGAIILAQWWLDKRKGAKKSKVDRHHDKIMARLRVEKEKNTKSQPTDTHDKPKESQEREP